MDFFNYTRRYSSTVQIGNISLGGISPVRVQSMANVSTMDTEDAVNQAIRMIEAGAELVRFTAQGEREAQNLQSIRKALNEKGYTTPLVADIHFNPKAADVAALYVEKVRINPGNYIDRARRLETIEYTDDDYEVELQKIREHFVPFMKLCTKHSTAIRIGVNHGSLSDRIMSRYGDTPEGMVESCMEFLRLCAEYSFENVAISIKASNTVVMIQTVRLLVRVMEAEGMKYPLHLGVTEAGDGEDGRIKSAVGIGTLLAEGLGDTIRVSLSEEPEAEMPVARKLLSYIKGRGGHPTINAIPSPLHDHAHPARQRSRAVNGIGGGCVPVVVSDRRGGDNSVDDSLKPDWIYTTPDNVQKYAFCERYIVDARHWERQANTYPCFSRYEEEEWRECSAETKFLALAYGDLSDDIIHGLKRDGNTVVILDSSHTNGVGEMRAFMHTLMNAGCETPVILRRKYGEDDMEAVQIQAAADFGALITDGFGDGIMLCNQGAAATLDGYMFGILQAARVRVSKTEYISCPGCGRTLFDLQKTIAQVRAATSHMKGLKIGIMGCVVNGPGEMADADFGYVGAGRGRINLYKGRECVMRNIPEDEAVIRLIELIADRD